MSWAVFHSRMFNSVYIYYFKFRLFETLELFNLIFSFICLCVCVCYPHQCHVITVVWIFCGQRCNSWVLSSISFDICTGIIMNLAYLREQCCFTNFSCSLFLVEVLATSLYLLRVRVYIPIFFIWKSCWADNKHYFIDCFFVNIVNEIVSSNKLTVTIHFHCYLKCG